MRTFGHQNWTGTITSFRFDPTNPSDTDSVYQVSRLGFFPSEAEAERFLDAAVDAPDYSEPTHFVAPLQRVLVPGDCLSDGFDRADFMLRSTAIDNPSETTVVRFHPKDAPGEASVVPLCQTNRRGFTRFVAKSRGSTVWSMVRLRSTIFPAWTREPGWRFNSSLHEDCSDEIQDRKFRPHDPLADADWNRAVALLAEYDIDLTAQAKPATRAEAAVVLKAAVQTRWEPPSNLPIRTSI
jgi:hypothetical protein